MKNSGNARKRRGSKESPPREESSLIPTSIVVLPSVADKKTPTQLPDKLWAASRHDHDGTEDSEVLGVCDSKRKAAIVAFNAAFICAQDRGGAVYDTTDCSGQPIRQADAFDLLLKGMPIFVIDPENARSDEAVGEWDDYISFGISSTTYVPNPQPVKKYQVVVVERYTSTTEVVAETEAEASSLVNDMVAKGELKTPEDGPGYDHEIYAVAEIESIDE